MLGRRTTQRWAASLGAVVVLTIAGCGSDEQPPVEAVPGLGTRLEQVDQAIEAGDDDATRAAVQALVAATARAQVADEITDDQASRIIEAARRLLRRLPGPDSLLQPETPSSPQGEESQPVLPLDPDEGDEDEDEEKDEKDKDDEKDEGRGNGGGSENGPDDGRGD
jgi:type IV secretory pathway VirB10-like protein